jgi:hypothetical protein
VQADLANSQARNTRLVAQVRRSERRLAELMGEQAWRDSGPGTSVGVEGLQSRAASPGQMNTELTARLEEGGA